MDLKPIDKDVKPFHCINYYKHKAVTVRIQFMLDITVA